MAATFAFRSTGEGFNPSKVPGAYFDSLVELTADAAYVAGGYAFGVAQLQTLTGGAGSMIESVEVVNHFGTSAGGGTVFVGAFYAKGTGKVQAFITGTAVTTAFQEAPANLASLSGLTCTLRVRWH